MREPGFYWVKYTINGYEHTTIGEWNPPVEPNLYWNDGWSPGYVDRGYWTFVGTDYYTSGEDGDVVILSERIVPPDGVRVGTVRTSV